MQMSVWPYKCRAGTDHRAGFSMWGQPDHAEQLGQSHNLDLLVHMRMVVFPDSRSTISSRSTTWRKHRPVRFYLGAYSAVHLHAGLAHISIHLCRTFRTQAPVLLLRLHVGHRWSSWSYTSHHCGLSAAAPPESLALDHAALTSLATKALARLLPWHKTACLGSGEWSVKISHPAWMDLHTISAQLHQSLTDRNTETQKMISTGKTVYDGQV